MKVIISDCGRGWFFNVKLHDDHLQAGLACFVSDCPTELALTMKGQKLIAALPHRAIHNPMPCRMVNARLTLLR